MIMEGIKKGELFGRGSTASRELGDFLATMMPGIYGQQELPLITDVLSLIDHLQINKNSPWPGLKLSELRYFRRLLERAIFEIIEGPDVEYQSEVPTPLKQFSSFVRAISEDTLVHIISTNYDIYLETELNAGMEISEISASVDYGFSWRDVADGHIVNIPQNPKTSIFKLHGSLNWLNCELCSYSYINTVGSVFHQAFREDIDDNNTCHCGHAPLNSVIIAPSIVRDIRDINVLMIWQNALEALRSSDEWMIVGYSFPIEDLAIRSMFVRAYNGREKKPKITVVQKGDESKQRYSLLFREFDYYDQGLEAYLRKMLIS
ncbi:MAG: SIR2 family protein [Planctomycetota bacterium]